MEDKRVLKTFVGDSIRDSLQEMKDSISKDLAECRSMLLEVLGKKDTTSFEPENIVMNVKLWQFRGENPDAWIVQAEHYFNCYKIEEDQKLNVASFYFDGEALEWYGWLFRNNQLAGWDHFVDKLMIHFLSRTRDTSRRFLPIPKNKNDRTVDYYQEAIPLWGNITNSSSPQSYQYNLFAKNSEVDHMFDKILEKGNDVDSSDSTSVEENNDTFEEMDNMPSLIVSSVLSGYNQMVTDTDLSNNITNDEAISIPNKVLSELPQYGHDQSSRESGQHVRTTSLLLRAFDVHNDHSMNTSFLCEVVDDVKLVKAITAVKYWKLVVVGPAYSDSELLDDLGLFSMDEVTVKHFRISTTRMFDDTLRWSCVIGCGHKVARPLIEDPNFSWTVIFKEFVLKDIDKEVDKAFPSFTNIYLLVDVISAIDSNIVWNARIALLEAGMVVHSVHRHQPQDNKLVRNGNSMEEYINRCCVRFFIHFVVTYNMDVVYMIHRRATGVIDNGGTVNWTRTYHIAGVAKRMNTSVSVAAESNEFTCLMSLDRPKALSYEHHLRGVCCSDICHFGGVIVLVKAGQYVQETTGVVSISLILSKDNITLHLTSEHLDHFIWPSSLLDGGMLFHFTLVTLKCVETATRQIIERVLDGFHDLNLEDKVSF
ncbi:uncharacterized protein [Solanum tuberosum]|uniref:uncharacterized protein n=1 Tax=Solanum tuberosum TaxID=4113 RepID=UPI00073A27A7|nr:PREDICTED: uncharacterized protein LOC107061760 [Solanum tuberosum]